MTSETCLFTHVIERASLLSTVTVPVVTGLYSSHFSMTINSWYTSATVPVWEFSTLESGEIGKHLKLLNAPTKS